MRLSQTGTNRIVIHPFSCPEQGLDVTDRVIETIAGEIGRLSNGNQVLNRLEAEMLLADLLQPNAVAQKSGEAA